MTVQEYLRSVARLATEPLEQALSEERKRRPVTAAEQARRMRLDRSDLYKVLRGELRLDSSKGQRVCDYVDRVKDEIRQEESNKRTEEIEQDYQELLRALDTMTPEEVRSHDRILLEHDCRREYELRMREIKTMTDEEVHAEVDRLCRVKW